MTRHTWKPVDEGGALHKCTACGTTWTFVPTLNGDVLTDGPEPSEECAHAATESA